MVLLLQYTAYKVFHHLLQLFIIQQFSSVGDSFSYLKHGVIISTTLSDLSTQFFLYENFFFHTRMLQVRLLILVLSIISVVHSFIINSREWNSGVVTRLIDTWSNLDIISDEDILETEDVEMIWNLEL